MRNRKITATRKELLVKVGQLTDLLKNILGTGYMFQGIREYKAAIAEEL